jgi:hypothetical protein
MLSTKWIVGIGLISYSAYLWHHPFFAFARILTLNNVDQRIAVLLIALTFLSALFTWRFVETPFRRRRIHFRKEILALSAVSSLFFVVAGALGNYFQSTGDGAYLKRPNYGLGRECEFATDFTPIPACVTSNEPKVVVWGDSYAMHLVPALIASEPAIRLAQATRSVCGPVIGVGPFINAASYYSREWANECIKFNQSVFSYIERQRSVEVVILSSPFVQYVDGGIFSLLTPYGVDAPSLKFAIEKMKMTIDALRNAGKRVVIVAPLPRADYNMGDCAERLSMGKPIFGRLDTCQFDRDAYLARQKPVMAFLESMEKDGYISVFRFDDYLCDHRICSTAKNGIAIYRDTEHLSYAGAELLGREIGFAKQIDRIAQ